MSIQVCKRCILTSSFPRIHFDNKGVCSVCQEYDRWTKDWKSKLPEKRKILDKICKKAKDKQKEFDALIPLSGGKDSTYVLYVAKKELGLNCLAYTLDFGYLSEYARRNIEKSCKILGVEHIYYCFDSELMHRLFALFIRKTGNFCAVCMRAIQMGTARIQDMYRIPLIIRGSSLRTELPLSREMFQNGSINYIRNVLKGEAISTKCRRLLYGGSLRRKLGTLLFWLSGKKYLSTYAWFNLADYVEWNYDVINNTIREQLDWLSPEESEHMDCILHPIPNYIQKRRFPGLSQKKLTLARLVMAGQITREEALRKMDEPMKECPDSVLEMFLHNIRMSREEFDKYVDMGPRHLNFNTPSKIEKLVMKLFSFRKAGEY